MPNIDSLNERYAKNMLIFLLNHPEGVMHKDLTVVVKNPYTRDKLLKYFDLENLVDISVDTKGGKKYNIKLTEKGVVVAKLLKVTDAVVSSRTDAYGMYSVGKEMYIQTKVSEILSMLDANENKEKVAMYMYELGFILASSPECTLSEDTKNKIEELISKSQKKYGRGSFEPALLIHAVLYDRNNFMESERSDDSSYYLEELSKYAHIAMEGYMKLWEQLKK